MHMTVFNFTLPDGVSFHLLPIPAVSSVRNVYFKSRGNLALTYKTDSASSAYDTIRVDSIFETPQNCDFKNFAIYVKGTSADVIEGHYVL